MMRELSEVLSESLAAHAAAIARTGVSDTLTGAAVAHARRRRALRSAGTGGVAVAAVGALVFGGVTLPGHLSPDVDRPGAGPSWSLALGAPAWCDLSTYPLPNLEAWGPARFKGRIYANYETEEYVFTGLDGSHTVLEPSLDGNLEATVNGDTFFLPGAGAFETHAEEAGWTIMIFDEWAGGGGGMELGEGDDPGLAYEWTTVAAEPVPSEINLSLLAEVHIMSIGSSGTGLTQDVAGRDAVVETVARYDDGTEDVNRILLGEPGASIKDYTGLVSVATRVTLPSGEVYELTSTYDASMTYASACLGQGATPSPVPSEAPVVADGASDEEDPFAYGPFLTGPEAAVFMCGVPLPEGLEPESVDVEFVAGLKFDPELGAEIDFGEGGFALQTVAPVYTDPDVFTTPFPGWSGISGSQGEFDVPSGVVTFDAVVWVDNEDRIVARQVYEDPALDESRLEGFDNEGLVTYDAEVGGMQGRTWWTGPVVGTGVACDGVSQDTVDSASVVIIHGYGPDDTAMTWQVIRP